MATPILQTASGGLALGRELGRGGEGTVFEVVGRPDLVAKVYHTPPSQEKAAKLLAMLKLATPQVLSLAAWPREVLRARDGRIHGLLMPNLAGYKDIHSLYGPKSRRADFPDADWRHLVRAATNIARAFATLHEVGCVIGDVNHGGIRVATDMTVKLIDCDSFQVQDGGHTFFCEVGVENFTPPELQGRPLRAVTRTANHDNFGLAVMAFYLLILGRHPFAGRYSGKGEMPIEKAIAEHRYAYGRNARANLMDPPPYAPPVLVASNDVANLWERAFSASAAAGSGRPTAREWITHLSALEQSATKCRQHPGHYYHAAAGACPWCTIETSSGALLFFIPIAAVPTRDLFNLGAVWSQIAQVESPGPVPSISLPTAQPGERTIELAKARSRSKLVGRISIVIALVIALAAVPEGVFLWWIAAVGLWVGLGKWCRSGRALVRCLGQRQEAAGRLTRINELLCTETNSKPFDEQIKMLEGKRVELQSLPVVRDRRMKALVADRESRALQHFLESQKIEYAKISGVGPAKRAMLQSYNIETAADITRNAILDVPGFGPALATRLEDWRHSVERTFRFNPNSPVEAKDIADLDRKLAQERRSLELALLQGANELSRIRQQILLRREALLAQAATFAQAFAQAEADRRALSDQT